ncbi:MAG: DUF2914 domain-containing protein, partial [Deltaproteobacteria bacterium]|nr:DUF2914 domain-containing protein [Deltaproteobacteria bacterium]
GVSDREPYGIAEEFSVGAETVFCFLEAENIELDRIVSFVWYFEGEKKARVSLPIQEGKRWRTYSSKKIAQLKGNWTVELQDESGVVLSTVSFRIH